MMMHSDIGLPSWERSCETKKRRISSRTLIDCPPPSSAERGGLERDTHLDVVALVVVAALAEQAVLDDSVDVELVKDGIGVLGEGGGEDDDLVDLAHGLEEGCLEEKRYVSARQNEAREDERLTIDSRSLDNIDVVVLVLNLDGNDVVCLVYHLREREEA